jgi:hypothetical protein
VNKVIVEITGNNYKVIVSLNGKTYQQEWEIASYGSKSKINQDFENMMERVNDTLFNGLDDIVSAAHEEYEPDTYVIYLAEVKEWA